MRKTVVWVIAFLMLLQTPVYAASPWTNHESYAAKTGHKLLFGLRNVVFGWTELWTEPIEAADRGDNPFAAIGTGFVNFLGQTVGGALHIVTFPIPVDIPLPEGGVDY